MRIEQKSRPVDQPEAGTEPETREIVVEQNVLAHNDTIAAEIRLRLKQNGTVAVNIISSPGSGKTTLLERTLEMLNGKVKCAVITGDQQTDHDARRLQGKGAKIRQIETYTSCHLNAGQIRDALPEVIDAGTQLLFIENVGNLVCPAGFDIGENFKIALLSTTEGEDKPVKYPVLFSDARAVVVSKTDLIPHLDWNLEQCRAYIRQINPGIRIFELSARTGEGMDAWIAYLQELVHC